MFSGSGRQNNYTEYSDSTSKTTSCAPGQRESVIKKISAAHLSMGNWVDLLLVFPLFEPPIIVFFSCGLVPTAEEAALAEAAPLAAVDGAVAVVAMIETMKDS